MGERASSFVYCICRGGKKKTRKEPQTVEAFEGALREEISVSSELGLTLSVLALRVEDGPDLAVRRVLGALRVADLVAKTSPQEILVALPNTVAIDARVVENRLREAVPKAALGLATYGRGDAYEDLIKRALSAVPPAGAPGEGPTGGS